MFILAFIAFQPSCTLSCSSLTDTGSCKYKFYKHHYDKHVFAFDIRSSGQSVPSQCINQGIISHMCGEWVSVTQVCDYSGMRIPPMWFHLFSSLPILLGNSKDWNIHDFNKRGNQFDEIELNEKILFSFTYLQVANNFLNLYYGRVCSMWLLRTKTSWWFLVFNSVRK